MIAQSRLSPFALPGKGERRIGDRRMIDEASTLRGSDDQPIDVTVGDLSTSGFNIFSDRELPIGAVVHLGLPGKGRFAARVVRREGDRYGCAFFDYLPDQVVADAFEESSVTQLFVAPGEWRLAEPAVQKWPRQVRMSLAIVAALLGWGAILWWLLG